MSVERWSQGNWCGLPLQRLWFSRFGGKTHEVLSIVPISDRLGALHGGNGDDFVVPEGLLHQV